MTGRTLSCDLLTASGADSWEDPAELHLFALSPSLFRDNLSILREALSEGERLEYATGRPSAVLERTVSRGILRLVLGQRLNVSPDQISFTLSPRGKPSVCDSQLSFNLSHSGDLVLIALSRSNSVGVDVEAVPTKIAARRLARRFLQENEAIYIESLDPASQAAAFIRCWTRKEAVTKVLGLGIWDTLARLEVAMGDVPEITALNLPGIDPRTIGLADIPVDPGYRAAAAWIGTDCAVRWCRLAPEDLKLLLR